MPEELTTPLPSIHELPRTAELSQTPRQIDSQVSTEIDNTNKNFKGQQKHEVVLCFTRKHWIVLLPFLIGFAIFILAVISFFLFVSSEYIASVMSPFTYRIGAGIVVIGFSIYIHRFFINFLNYYLRICIITNFRVVQIDKTLFFHHGTDSIDLREIQDIVVNRNGVIKTLLNYGELIITLSSAHATKILQCVPNPEYYFRKINKTKREYITKRRLEKTGN